MTRFGSRKQFPPTLMAESLFQLANFLIYKTFRTKLAILTRFDRIEIKGVLGPGDILTMRVRLHSVIGESVTASTIASITPSATHALSWRSGWEPATAETR